MANGPDFTYPPVGARQNVIRGAGTLPDAADPSVPAAVAGVVLATGTYLYSIPVNGAGVVDITLRASASTGTGLASVASVYKALIDGSTEKMGAAGASAAQLFSAFVVGVQQTMSIAGLRGEKFVLLKIVVPGASSLTLDVAEFSAGNAPSGASHSAVTLLPSAARTTTQTSADIPLFSERFLDVILDMTVVGTGSVTITINGKDPASGKYYPLLAGAAVITNGTNVYRVGPALVAAANAIANAALPKVIQIVVTANNANPATYSVGYNLSV